MDRARHVDGLDVKQDGSARYWKLTSCKRPDLVRKEEEAWHWIWQHIAVQIQNRDGSRFSHQRFSDVTSLICSLLTPPHIWHFLGNLPGILHVPEIKDKQTGWNDRHGSFCTCYCFSFPALPHACSISKMSLLVIKKRSIFFVSRWCGDVCNTRYPARTFPCQEWLSHQRGPKDMRKERRLDMDCDESMPSLWEEMERTLTRRMSTCRPTYTYLVQLRITFKQWWYFTSGLHYCFQCWRPTKKLSNKFSWKNVLALNPNNRVSNNFMERIFLCCDRLVRNAFLCTLFILKLLQLEYQCKSILNLYLLC